MSSTPPGPDVPDLDGPAFLADFATLSTFGALPGGGVERQAASDADGEQRRWFAGVLQSRGFRVERDEVGNLFGLLELNPGAPWVLTGSHLDSQPTAGAYDGAYGVLASAHACFRVAAAHAAAGTRPALNLAVVDWFNEEGSRFKPSMMGSAVLVGKLPLEQALATPDPSGVTVAQALDALGERGRFVPSTLEVASYAEIHIEQGRSLEDSGTTIGLVEATWAANKMEFVVEGAQSHSGSTVMADRRDALYGAALLVVAVREVADRHPGLLHTAVGELTVYPNSPVTVASEVALHADLRSPDAGVIEEATRWLLTRIEEIEEQARVTVRRTGGHSWDVNPYQPEGVKLARAVAEELGLTHGGVMTVAGHDSTNMKDVVPSVMLFVPSVEGVSHHVAELTRDEDLVAGLDVLTGVVTRLADGELAQLPLT